MMFSSVDVMEKENIPREVAALITPRRCPLGKIQENQICASPLATVKKRAASIGPHALHKAKRQPKRLSVPFHALSKVLESETISVQSPVKTWKRQQLTELDCGSPLYREADRYCTPVSKALDSSCNSSVCKSVDRYVCEERKDVQKLIHGVASAILKEMKKDEVDKDSAEQKVKEYEKTIIQMNKERLLFEKQLSLSAKPKVEKKNVQHQTVRRKAKPTIVDHESRAKDSLIKQLEKDLERKKTELLRTRDELKHTQEHLLEIPTLKSELHKNKQEMKGLNKVVFSCREENTKLKREIEKCNNSLTEKDKMLKEHKETNRRNTDELKGQLNQRTSEVSNIKKELEKGHKDLWCMRSKLEQRASEVKKLQEQITSQEKELEVYKNYCLTLEIITEKLEGDVSVVELKKASVINVQNSLMLQIKDLSEKCSDVEDKLEKQTQALQELNVRLQESRANEDVLKSENQELAGSLSSLQSELDIDRLEIMRQQGVIMRQENELGQNKVQLCRYQEHIELLEAQEKEVNEFVEEERKTLVNTAKDLETQLLSTKDELYLVNMSCKEKSLKYEEFAEEVKQSKDQLQEKQEELNATQTQAHWMLLQQQMEMIQAAEALKEAWNVVDGMLKTFSREAGIHLDHESTEDLEERPASEDMKENNESESPPQLLSSSSLVQRVLEATANRENQSAVDDARATSSPVEDETTAGLPVEDAQEAGPPVHSRARRELNYDPEQSERAASTQGNEPQSLAEQVYELRQALERLAEIGSGKTADAHAQMTIRRLEEERNSDETKFQNSLKDIELKLDTSRINEVQLHREIEHHCLQTSQLKASLEESQQNLQIAMAKIDSLSLQCTEQIEQETQVKMLSMENKGMLEEIERLKSAKECLSEELKETFDKLDQLTRGQNVTDVERMTGKLLDEKFTLERRLKQVKEKSLNYRLEMQDYVAEYRARAENKIRILERNLQKAESEIRRLDDMIESVRLALHQHKQQSTSTPELSKLLQFIEGDDC